MVVRQLLSEIVSAAFIKLGYPGEYGAVTASNRPDLCQFQCNGAMSLAKSFKTAPMNIATSVADALSDCEALESATAAPPGFININLSDKTIAAALNDMNRDPGMLLPKIGENKVIVVDYGGPNIAKPLHIGHLRSAIIGDALCGLARLMGATVIGDTHLGDWGLQVGLVIAAIEDMSPDLPYFDARFAGDYPDASPLTADELNTVYPAASARANTDSLFAARAREATRDLQSGRAGYVELWRRIKSASCDDMKRNYDKLGVSFDKWLGESDAEPYVERAISIMRDRGLLRESDGAVVVDVAKDSDREPMPPMIVKKSNGADIYGTTDLATLVQRIEDWKPDEIWYVVDSRQSLHFKQVFRAAENSGIVDPDKTKLSHFPFGTMKGKDGKPYKTREGGVMRLSDMIDLVTRAAREKTESSSVDMDGAERENVSRMVGVAALKVGDLINHWGKDYVFDLDRFLMTEGKTGPYLQYAAVRIGSVLEKATAAKIDGSDGRSPILSPSSDCERITMLRLIGAADAASRAYAEKAPSAALEYLFDLCGAFNRFYYEQKVIAFEEDPARRASWLALYSLTRRVILVFLNALGIKTPKNM